jgi:hypothetical protein
MRAFESEASDKIFWDNDEEKTVHEMPKPEDPTLQHCKSAVQNIPQVYLVPGCILVENHSQNCFEITSESARVLIVRSEKRTEKKENPQTRTGEPASYMSEAHVQYLKMNNLPQRSLPLTC